APPVSPLFPYTSLFRSMRRRRRAPTPPPPLLLRLSPALPGLFDALASVRSAPRRPPRGAPDPLALAQVSSSFGNCLRSRRIQRVDRKSTRLNSSHVKIS